MNAKDLTDNDIYLKMKKKQEEHLKKKAEEEKAKQKLIEDINKSKERSMEEGLLP